MPFEDPPLNIETPGPQDRNKESLPVIGRISAFTRSHILFAVFLAITAGCATRSFNTFESKVLKSDNVYLVEVTGEFCPMCRVSEDEVKAFEEIEGHRGRGKGIKVYRIKTEEYDFGLAMWLIDHGFDNNVPFYIIVKDGEVVAKRTGAFFTLEEVEKFIGEAGVNTK